MTGKEAVTGRKPAGTLARWVFAALIAAAAGLAISTLGPATVGEHARRSFLETLQRHYPDLRISIRRGHYDPRVGLVFEDIRIDDPSTSMFRPQRLLRVDRVVVVGDLDPQQLLDKQHPLAAQKIVIDGAEGDAWLRPDGTLSLAQLWPPPQLGPTCPRIEVVRGRLRLIDPSGKERPIGVGVDQALVQSADRAIDPSGNERPQSIVLRGTTDFSRSLQVDLRRVGDEVTLRLAMSELHLSDRWLRRLPAEWCPQLEQFHELRCVGELSAVATFDGESPANYEVRYQVDQGRFHHERLPKALSELRGRVTVTPEGVAIEPSQAKFGEALCRFHGSIAGLRWPCDVQLRIETSGLMLDQRLAMALAPQLQEHWDRLRAVGRVDLDGSITHADGEWETAGTLVCKGVDVRFDRFPYPVTQLVGKISIGDGWAASEGMSGRVGSSVLRSAFRVPLREELSRESSFAFQGDGVIPVDETLIEALTPRGEAESKLESFVRLLRPSGSVSLTSAVIRKDATGTTHRRFDLQVVNGHLRYNAFDYPLYNVTGRIRVEDEQMDLIDFKATNANAGVVHCHGAYRMPADTDVPSTGPAGRASSAGGEPHPDSLADLKLHFHAANVSMDNALRSALPASSQHVWDAVSPSGMLDELTVLVTRTGLDSPLNLDIEAVQKQTPQVTNRSLSLHPTAIPYRLDITGGSVHYDGEKVRIRSVTGRHDASHLSADGECVPTDGGRWVLSLNVHGGSRLFPDAELIEALPAEMEEAMRRLQLRGPISVRGSTQVLLSDQEHPEPTIDWDLLLQLEGNRIGDVGPVHSLRGELAVQGRHDEQALTTAGEVRIDSMHVHDLQIMGIRGPFTIVDDELSLGTFREPPALLVKTPPRDDATETSPRTIRGRIFDGILDLEGVVTLSSGDFDVRMAVREALVPTLLADLGHADQELTGTFAGQARLEGQLGSPELLSGNGAARVTGTNLYKLPLLVQVLNQLRITPTEDVAFTDGDVEFTIDDDQIRFSQLQLWGELVALHGYGTLNRRRELDLSFNTRVSPQNVFTRVVLPLRNSRYTLWTIDVRGPLGSPTIERRALDGVGQTLERLFPGISPEFIDRDDGDNNPLEPRRSLRNRWLESWQR